jgi:hypothetical protein
MSTPTPPSQIDIAASLKGQVTVTPEEHPDERAARLRNAGRRSVIEDWKGVAVFVVLLVSIISIGILAAYEGFFAGASPEAQKWGQTVLTALATGGISFFVGRKIGAAEKE